jgi:hypothetical protein
MKMKESLTIERLLIVALATFIIGSYITRVQNNGATAATSTVQSPADQDGMVAIKQELESQRQTIVKLIETLKTSTLNVAVSNQPSTIKLDPQTQVAISGVPSVKQDANWKVDVKSLPATKVAEQEWDYKVVPLMVDRGDAFPMPQRLAAIVTAATGGWELCSVDLNIAYFKKPKKEN